MGIFSSLLGRNKQTVSKIDTMLIDQLANIESIVGNMDDFDNSSYNSELRELLKVHY